MKLKEVFEKTVQFFKEKKLDTPRLDAEILISHVLKIQRIQLYVKYEQPLSDEEISACRELVKRRISGEPVAYIINEQGFYGEVFKVGSGVLIPRPETEALVEQALEFIKKNNLKNIRILDLGAGSGCIGLSLVKAIKDNVNKNNLDASEYFVSLVSVEKSPEAFKYLKINFENLIQSQMKEQIIEQKTCYSWDNMGIQVQLLQLDVNDVQFDKNEKFDVIVSNPPYISRTDSNIDAHVKAFEPDLALYADENGMACIQAWLNKSLLFLNTRSIVLFEIGYNQGQLSYQFAKEKKFFQNVSILKDLAGHDRVLVGTSE